MSELAYGMDSMFLRWLVLVAGCFTNANSFAIVLTFGSLFVPLMDKFQEDRATTATVQSIFMGIMMTSGMVWSMVSRKVGLARLVLATSWLVGAGFIVAYFATSILMLTIFIGILSGVGVSVMYVGSSIAIERAFVGAQVGLALALHQLFIGLGSLAYPFLLDALVNEYDLSGTLLILGGINLNNVPAGLVIYFATKTNGKNRSTDNNKNAQTEINKNDIELNDIMTDMTQPDETESSVEKTQRQTSSTDNKINAKAETKEHGINDITSDMDQQNGENERPVKKTHGSWFSRLIDYARTTASYMFTFRLGSIVIATSVSVAALNGFLVIVLDLFASKGFSPKQGLDSFTAFNTGHVLGKIVPAVLQFKSKLNPLIICIVSCGCGCVGQVLIQVFSNVYVVYVGSALSGVAIGAIISGSVVATLSVAPPGRFDEAFGITLSAIGILSSAAGPLYGWIRDDLHTYTVCMVLTASLLGACGLLFVASLFTRKPPQPQSPQPRPEDGQIYGSTRL